MSVCHSFAESGTCRFGDKCRYSHQPSSSNSYFGDKSWSSQPSVGRYTCPRQDVNSNRHRNSSSSNNLNRVDNNNNNDKKKYRQNTTPFLSNNNNNNSFSRSATLSSDNNTSSWRDQFGDLSRRINYGGQNAAAVPCEKKAATNTSSDFENLRSRLNHISQEYISKEDLDDSTQLTNLNTLDLSPATPSRICTSVRICASEHLDFLHRTCDQVVKASEDTHPALIAEIKQAVKQWNSFCFVFRSLTFDDSSTTTFGNSVSAAAASSRSIVAGARMRGIAIALRFISRMKTESRLPILAEYEAINRWCETPTSSVSPFMIMEAETGSGKSTTLPQYIAESCACDGKIVICTQPRSVAALALQKRVATEYCGSQELADKNRRVGVAAGGKRDYCVGRVRILFVTEHVLLRDIAEGRFQRYLPRLYAVILDEAHERTTACDMLLGLLKGFTDSNQHNSLRVVVSSATLDTTLFSKYLPGATHIKVPGRTFPVRIEYRPTSASSSSASRIDDAKRDFVKETVDTIVSVLAVPPFLPTCTSSSFISSSNTTTSPHHILAFLPSAETVDDAEDALKLIRTNAENKKQEQIKLIKSKKKIQANEKENENQENDEEVSDDDEEEEDNLALEVVWTNIDIYIISGRQTADEQSKIFDETEPGRQKVIIATAVAETSITIKNIGFVIDSGLSRAVVYDAVRKTSEMCLLPTSQSAAKQRAGRSGRTRAGVCIRLYSESNFNEMSCSKTCELKSGPLFNTCLRLKLYNKSFASFDWIEKPDKKSIDSTLTELELFGAIQVFTTSNEEKETNSSVESSSTAAASSSDFEVTEFGKFFQRVDCSLPLAKMLFRCLTNSNTNTGIKNNNNNNKLLLLVSFVGSLMDNASGIFFKPRDRVAEFNEVYDKISKEKNADEFGDVLTLLQLALDFFSLRSTSSFPTTTSSSATKTKLTAEALQPPFVRDILGEKKQQEQADDSDNDDAYTDIVEVKEDDAEETQQSILAGSKDPETKQLRKKFCDSNFLRQNILWQVHEKGLRICRGAIRASSLSSSSSPSSSRFSFRFGRVNIPAFPDSKELQQLLPELQNLIVCSLFTQYAVKRRASRLQYTTVLTNDDTFIPNSSFLKRSKLEIIDEIESENDSNNNNNNNDAAATSAATTSTTLKKKVVDAGTLPNYVAYSHIIVYGNRASMMMVTPVNFEKVVEQNLLPEHIVEEVRFAAAVQEVEETFEVPTVLFDSVTVRELTRLVSRHISEETSENIHRIRALVVFEFPTNRLRLRCRRIHRDIAVPYLVSLIEREKESLKNAVIEVALAGSCRVALGIGGQVINPHSHLLLGSDPYISLLVFKASSSTANDEQATLCPLDTVRNEIDRFIEIVKTNKKLMDSLSSPHFSYSLRKIQQADAKSIAVKVTFSSPKVARAVRDAYLFSNPWQPISSSNSPSTSSGEFVITPTRESKEVVRITELLAGKSVVNIEVPLFNRKTGDIVDDEDAMKIEQELRKLLPATDRSQRITAGIDRSSVGKLLLSCGMPDVGSAELLEQSLRRLNTSWRTRTEDLKSKSQLEDHEEEEEEEDLSANNDVCSVKKTFQRVIPLPSLINNTLRKELKMLLKQMSACDVNVVNNGANYELHISSDNRESLERAVEFALEQSHIHPMKDFDVKASELLCVHETREQLYQQLQAKRRRTTVKFKQARIVMDRSTRQVCFVGDEAMKDIVVKEAKVVLETVGDKVEFVRAVVSSNPTARRAVREFKQALEKAEASIPREKKSRQFFCRDEFNVISSPAVVKDLKENLSKHLRSINGELIDHRKELSNVQLLRLQKSEFDSCCLCCDSLNEFSSGSSIRLNCGCCYCSDCLAPQFMNPGEIQAPVKCAMCKESMLIHEIARVAPSSVLENLALHQRQTICDTLNNSHPLNNRVSTNSDASVASSSAAASASEPKKCSSSLRIVAESCPQRLCVGIATCADPLASRHFYSCSGCASDYCRRCTDRVGKTRVVKQHPPGKPCVSKDQAGIQTLIQYINEKLLPSRCPNCSVVFYDYDGCAAITCGCCKASFCGCCLKTCVQGDPHEHVNKCKRNPLPGNLFLPREKFFDLRDEDALNNIITYLNSDEVQPLSVSTVEQIEVEINRSRTAGSDKREPFKFQDKVFKKERQEEQEEDDDESSEDESFNEQEEDINTQVQSLTGAYLGYYLHSDVFNAKLAGVVAVFEDILLKNKKISNKHLHSHGLKCNGFRVKKVFHLEHPFLWKKYVLTRDEIAGKRKHNSLPKLPGLEHFDWCKNELQLRSDANELLLFHGLKETEVADIIVRKGFDTRVCKANRISGAGIYGAMNSSKSDEYCAPGADGLCCMFLVRVTMGTFFGTDRVHPDFKRPPCLQHCRMTPCAHEICDSVLSVCKRSGYQNAHLHRYDEFVVYDSAQSYPEFLIYYERI